MFDEPEELVAFIEKYGGYWDGECPSAPLADWWTEVKKGDTRMSYWEWAYRVTEGE